jgi:hypothetical protein
MSHWWIGWFAGMLTSRNTVATTPSRTLRSHHASASSATAIAISPANPEMKYTPTEPNATVAKKVATNTPAVRGQPS